MPDSAEDEEDSDEQGTSFDEVISGSDENEKPNVTITEIGKPEKPHAFLQKHTEFYHHHGCVNTEGENRCGETSGTEACMASAGSIISLRQHSKGN